MSQGIEGILTSLGKARALCPYMIEPGNRGDIDFSWQSTCIVPLYDGAGEYLGDIDFSWQSTGIVPLYDGAGEYLGDIDFSWQSTCIVPLYD